MRQRRFSGVLFSVLCLLAVCASEIQVHDNIRSWKEAREACRKQGNLGSCDLITKTRLQEKWSDLGVTGDDSLWVGAQRFSRWFWQEGNNGKLGLFKDHGCYKLTGRESGFKSLKSNGPHQCYKVCETSGFVYLQDSDADSEGSSPERLGLCSSPCRCRSPHARPPRDSMNATWHTGLVGSGHEGRGPRLQRRHTITVCESPMESKLSALQELPPVEEEEEPSPTEDQTPRFQYGSDSPLSGLPDHTLHNGHNLLRGGGRPMYRSEHRRSLTTGLTAIPEDDDATECGGDNSEGPFRRRDRRHSMPTVPHRLDVGRFSPKLAGSRTGEGGEFTTIDCHSHFLLNPEKPGHWCRMRGGRSSFCDIALPPEVSRSAGEGGAEGEAKDLALLTATENMHVSGEELCPDGAADCASACQHCRSVPKRWQNPIECLSLTLEEVTHIRSVLTKAELESLVSHPDLYNQVAKNKVCFTCKTTRFSLFGEWGNRCKFCKCTVCSKCMRKMYMPTEQLKDVPVYTLSSSPLSQETLALVHNYVQSNAIRRTSSPCVNPKFSCGSSFASDHPKGKHFLQRSQSVIVPGNTGGGARRGPLTSICCDCKSMISEILRASKSSLDVLLPILQSAGTSAVLSDPSSSPTSSSSLSTSTLSSS